jgi:hypothetical protein
MGKFSDSLGEPEPGSQTGDLESLWNSAEAAPELRPLPAGKYDCRVAGIERFKGRRNATPGVKITFAVADGQFANRRLWADYWLTPAAIGQTKRELAKLGITELAQVENPNPAAIRRIRCRVAATLRTADDGTEFNAVRSFVVTGIDPETVDPFLAGGEGDNATAEGQF